MSLRSLRTGIRDSCDLSCGCWELKPRPLKEHAVFFTAEPQRGSERKPHLSVSSSMIGFLNYICVFIHVRALSSVVCECLHMLITSSFTLEEGIEPHWD